MDLLCQRGRPLMSPFRTTAYFVSMCGCSKELQGFGLRALAGNTGSTTTQCTKHSFRNFRRRLEEPRP